MDEGEGEFRIAGDREDSADFRSRFGNLKDIWKGFPLSWGTTPLASSEAMQNLQRLAESNREAIFKLDINLPRLSLPDSALPIPEIRLPDMTAYSALAGSFTHVQSLVASLQPQMFDLAHVLAQALADRVPAFDIGIDFEGFRLATLPLLKKAHVLEVLSRSNWPLYLVGDDELTAKLEDINLAKDDVTIADDVSELAVRYLNDEWLASVANRWAEVSGFSADEDDVLAKALSYHKSRDYAACVAVLMCVFEGLIASYFGPSVVLDSEKERDPFDYLAEEYGLQPTFKRKTPRLENTKDLVLIALLRAEDGGLLVWQHAVDYVIRIVLTNIMDEGIAAHNPLRNKICHGVQTNYDTQEHSLKAILATDLVIQLGSAAAEGMQLRLSAEGDQGGGVVRFSALPPTNPI